MPPRAQLGDLLRHYVRRVDTTPDRLAKLSGVPKATIVNWLERGVKRTHDWRGLLAVARVLGLSTLEANELLRAAGQPALAEVLQQAIRADDRARLAAWLDRSQPACEVAAPLPYVMVVEHEALRLPISSSHDYRSIPFLMPVHYPSARAWRWGATHFSWVVTSSFWPLRTPWGELKQRIQDLSIR